MSHELHFLFTYPKRTLQKQCTYDLGMLGDAQTALLTVNSLHSLHPYVQPSIIILFN